MANKAKLLKKNNLNFLRKILGYETQGSTLLQDTLGCTKLPSLEKYVEAEIILSNKNSKFSFANSKIIENLYLTAKTDFSARNYS